LSIEPVAGRGPEPAERYRYLNGADAIAGEVATKWAGHAIGRVNFVRPDRSMSQIGA
jgi:hypothetical protein